jgi:tripartite-type tricarboxylate transporter receptor subunit TctC
LTGAPAGSGPDVAIRLAADRLAKVWGQQVLVVNRAGSGGVLAHQAITAAEPDGYTLYAPVASGFIVLPHAQPKLASDLYRVITPIGLLGEQPMVIAVNPSLGINALADLIARAKERPREVLYGAPRATFPHLTGIRLGQNAGIELGFVPTGMARVVQDAMGGSLQVVIESLSALAGPMQSGTLKALAITSLHRLPDYPDLPTVTEALPQIGLFEAKGWVALAARTGTPDAIAQKINADLGIVLADAELKQKFVALGTYPRPLSIAETTEFIRREQELWRPIVRQIDFTNQ